MKILIKGAGDLATGIAFVLHGRGYDILMTEIAAPLTVRRTVAMSRAVCEGEAHVEGMTGVLVTNLNEAVKVQAEGKIAVIVDETAAIRESYEPDVVVDAILAKKNLGTAIQDAPFVIGAGPGFTAGKDCHCVIETKRGESLGRIIWQGSALPNTGIPGEISGYSEERLIKASAEGTVHPRVSIGDMVKKGQIVAYAGNRPVYARMDGIVRGMLQPGVFVTEGLKIGDIDARANPILCHTVSDKARRIGESVLRAVRISQCTQAVVLLAAGESRRFGGNKLMAMADGKPLYSYAMHLLDNFTDIMKVIVTGQEPIRADALAREFLVVENRNPDLGISLSVKMGLKACIEKAKGLQSVMFMVCDQPALTEESVKRLLKASGECPGQIVCASVDGESRNPVVWDKRFWAELLDITGDTGGKQIMERHQDKVVLIEVKQEEVKDIDRKADLMRNA